MALKNLGVPIKSIDYVEIDEAAVRSYNSMFKDDLEYQPQDVRGWNLRPDILIHGSPCQSFSIAGHQGKATAEGGRINRGAGGDEGSGTTSSLMWETLQIIRNLGDWKPKDVVWENVKNVLSKHMNHNFKKYLREMESMGYANSYQILNAKDFGVPQNRERVFTVSVLGSDPFDFGQLETKSALDLKEILEPDAEIGPEYNVTQPSILEAIGKSGIRRATVITDCCYTITCRQDRTPAQVVQRPDGSYRFLTERECYRAQGIPDVYFDKAAAVTPKRGRFRMPLYKQAGNAMAVPCVQAILKEAIRWLREEHDGTSEFHRNTIEDFCGATGI